ncbi:MAG TPA: type II toxin-antitoxin system PrlF family antitoxin [Verrucomicrobiae bacterium]|nr:type II toxin-antitoxin system PrlF family antitoxin [Verrucomicrobiae bacterium]
MKVSAIKPATKPAKLRKAKKEASGCYHGKQARTGNSLGFRFDKALFQSHPEFSGDVRGHVIAPGSMLVVAEDPVPRQRRTQEDPMLVPFLSLLAQDIAQSPRSIRPLDQGLADRIQGLVGHLEVNPDEDLGDDNLI